LAIARRTADREKKKVKKKIARRKRSPEEKDRQKNKKVEGAQRKDVGCCWGWRRRG
jgi:hypothetical protein